jgi:Fe-S oxidoreductase
MRAIAEEAFDLVAAYKGSHSGEHGDGIVRSEFHKRMFGLRIADDFEEVKDRFDPSGLFNPGKIVRAPKFDDRSLLRYASDYRVPDMQTELDWSEYTGSGSGFQGAIEMCNNNGACRKHAGGVMCPSFRVTGDERDVTRGRANSLRLAISGQLGPDAFISEEMAETLKLCVSCKGCRRECPTGVDMARFKIEFLAARFRKFGMSLHDRLVGFLPRYAPLAAKIPWLLNLRDVIPGAAKLSEAIAGFTSRRQLPRWRSDVFREPAEIPGTAGKEVVLFADTFNRYFERENLDATLKVLKAAGYTIYFAGKQNERPLCCGRTFLSVGRTDLAREEAQRTIAALKPYIIRDIPVIGLEPSCIFGFRDEIPALLKSDLAKQLAQNSFLLEEFLVREEERGALDLELKPLGKPALLHGHCHQKAFGALGAVEKALRLVPDIKLETVESSCCGMAGSFGYGGDTIEVSLAMGELSLLPAVRKAPADAIIVADGTSCRQQIHDGTGREAMHVARVLAMSLNRNLKN